MIYTLAHNAPKECVLGNRLVNYSDDREKIARASTKSGAQHQIFNARAAVADPTLNYLYNAFSQADLNKNDTMGFDLRVGG